jgi:hypothetical protein
MSLIQKALRKSAENQESPPPLPPVLNERKKGTGSFSNKQIGLVIVLLFCLVGVLVYSFYPYLWNPGKNKIAAAPKTAVVKEPPPGPKIPGDKERTQALPGNPPSTPTAGPKDQSPVREKPLSPPLVSEIKPKDAPGGTLLASRQKAPETEKSLESKNITRTVSPTATPPPKVEKAGKQAPPKKIGPPKEGSAGDADMAKTPTEKDSEVVRLFNDAVRDHKIGLLDQAIQGYQEVAHLRPNHPEAYNNLGLIYQEQKQFSKALGMFQKALSLNPQYIKGYNNLGLLYLSQGKWEEAAAEFNKALQLDFSFVPAYINLSAVYKNQGRADLARKTLYQALEQDGNNLEAQYNLGLLWEREGYTNKAIEHYQKFVSKAYGPYSGLANELRKKWPDLK